MNLFTKNIRGFVDFGKQAEPKNPCVALQRILKESNLLLFCVIVWKSLISSKSHLSIDLVLSGVLRLGANYC